MAAHPTDIDHDVAPVTRNARRVGEQHATFGKAGFKAVPATRCYNSADNSRHSDPREPVLRQLASQLSCRSLRTAQSRRPRLVRLQPAAPGYERAELPMI